MKNNLGIIRFTSIFMAFALGISCLEGMQRFRPVINSLGQAGKRAFKAKPTVQFNPTSIMSPKGEITTKQMDAVNEFFKKYPIPCSKNAGSTLARTGQGNIKVSRRAWENILLDEKPNLFKLFSTKGGIFKLTASKQTTVAKIPKIKNSPKAKELPRPETAKTQLIPTQSPVVQPKSPNTRLVYPEVYTYTHLRGTTRSLFLNPRTHYKSFFTTLPLTRTSNALALAKPERSPSHYLQPFFQQKTNEVHQLVEAPQEQLAEQQLVDPAADTIKSVEYDVENNHVKLKAGKNTYYISHEEYVELKKTIENIRNNSHVDLDLPIAIPLQKAGFTIIVERSKGTMYVLENPNTNSLAHESEHAIEYFQENNPTKRTKPQAIAFEEPSAPEHSPAEIMPDLVGIDIEQIPDPSVKLVQEEPPLITEEGGRNYINAKAQTVSTAPTPPLTKPVTQAAEVAPRPNISISTTLYQPAHAEAQSSSIAQPKNSAYMKGFKVPKRRPLPQVEPIPLAKNAFNPIKISAPYFQSGRTQGGANIPKASAPSSSPSNGNIPEVNPWIIQRNSTMPRFPRIHSTIRPTNLFASSDDSNNNNSRGHTFNVLPAGLLAGASQVGNDEEDTNTIDRMALDEDGDSLLQEDELLDPAHDLDPDPALPKTITPELIVGPDLKPIPTPKPFPLPTPIPNPTPVIPKPTPTPEPGPVPTPDNTTVLQGDLGTITVPPARKSSMSSTPPPLPEAPNIVHSERPVRFNVGPKPTPAPTPAPMPSAPVVPSKEDVAKKDLANDAHNPVAPEKISTVPSQPNRSGKPQESAPYQFPPSFGSSAPKNNTAAPSSAAQQPMFKPATSTTPTAPATHNNPSTTPYQAPAVSIEKLKDAPATVIGAINGPNIGDKNPQKTLAAHHQPYAGNIPSGSSQATYDNTYNNGPIKSPDKLSTINFQKPSEAHFTTTTSGMPVESTAPQGGAWETVIKIGLYVMGVFNLAAGSVSTRWIRGILRLLRLSPA